MSDDILAELDRAQAAWRKLCGCFSGIKYVANRPKDMWTLIKRRFVGDVLINWNLTYWKKAKAILVSLTDPEIDYLRSLAQQRFESAASQFRLWAVSSVTIPVSIVVILNQLAPEWFRREFLQEPDETIFGLYVVFLTVAIVNLFYIFLNSLKAREMRMALELEAADRRFMRGETFVSAGGDTSDLSL